LFCSGHCFLSDGRLFVAGGQSTNNHPVIGLTQTAQSFSGGAPVLPPGTSTRTISSSDAIAINTGTGETDEGSKIDRVSPYNKIPSYYSVSTLLYYKQTINHDDIIFFLILSYY
jgi:hypothetical protein